MEVITHIKSINDSYTNIICDKVNEVIKQSITIKGTVSNIKDYYRYVYFNLVNDGVINCYCNDDELNEIIKEHDKDTITVIGKLNFIYHKALNTYGLQLSVKQILDIDKETKVLDNKYLIKKHIDWDNIHNVMVLSKYNTHGYNDFIYHLNDSIITSMYTKYKLLIDKFDYYGETGIQLFNHINFDLHEIPLQGDNVKDVIINKINNCKNYDLVLICRGGGSTEDIKASFDHLDLFDAMKNSKVPIITAIGHSDDDLIIDMVSDYKFTTPTEAGKFFYNIHVKQIKCIMDKCIKYINTCIEEEKIKYNIDWVKCIMKLLNKKLKDKITINEICDEGFIDFVIQNNNIDQFIVNVCNYIKDNINDIKKKLLILDTLNNNPKEIICDDEIIKLSYEFIDEYKNIQ